MSLLSNSRLLVGMQFTAIGLGLFPWLGSEAQLIWAVPGVLGVLVGIYTLAHNRLGNFGVFPELVNGARLITSGPYRWVRHPMYLSLLLFMLGASQLSHRLW